MRRAVVLIILFSIPNGGTQAQNIEELNKPFSTLCVGEKSTGFNWEQGEWVAVRFKLSKYIISKIQPDSPKAGSCKTTLKNVKSGSFQIWGWTEGCYNIRRMGTEFYPHLTQVCPENWEKSGSGHSITYIDCRKKGWVFRPNGNFIHSSIHVNLDPSPEKNYKDSLSISVGKCSVIP